MKKILLLAPTILCFLNLINAQAGQLDTSFGTWGIVRMYIGDSTTIYKNTAIRKDGKIVVAGSTWNGSDFEMVIVCYNTDGSPDSTFSNKGILTTGFTFPGEYRNNISILIQNDGKIVAESAAAGILARYNTDGTLDNTFSGNGKQTTNINIYSAAIQKDGKILVSGGEHVDEYPNIPVIARYNKDGSPDQLFGTNGKKTIILDIYDVARYGYFSSIVVQKDGKMVLTGIFGRYQGIVAIRLNADGNLDTTFNHSGIIFPGGLGSFSVSAIMQDDGKIVIATSDNYIGVYETSLLRYNADGSIDNSFSAKRISQDTRIIRNTSAALQSDGKIVVSGFDLSRFNTNGSLDSTFNINAKQKLNFEINDIVVSNNKLYVAGGGTAGAVARFLLNNNSVSPEVTLTAPADNTVRLAPAAHIRLRAVAVDKDGTITKVEFYNGTTLLHTETVFPYGYVWENVRLGHYTLTAKAYDNSGLVTTSAPVHISVVPNKPPVVSIIKPNNNQRFTAPGYIHLEAAASDTDGRVINVRFYNGSNLLRTEYEYPYTYHWVNVPAGTYTITAVATDNWGAHTISAPVTIIVKSVNTMMVSSKPVNNKTAINDEISLKLSPNPATNILNIYTKGLQQSKPATISIISVSGIVLKTVQTNNSTTELDVSALVSGVYTIKIVSEDITMYKKFVKL